MTTEEVARLRALEHQVSKRWTVDVDPRPSGADQIIDGDGMTVCFLSRSPDEVDDDAKAELIAASRNHLASLLAAAETLELVRRWAEQVGTEATTERGAGYVVASRAVLRILNPDATLVDR